MMTKTTSASRAMLKKIALVPLFSGIIFFACTKTVAQEKKTETISKLNPQANGMEHYFQETTFIIKDEKGTIVAEKKFGDLTNDEMKNIPPPPPPPPAPENKEEKNQQLQEVQNKKGPNFVEMATVKAIENKVFNTTEITERPTFPGGMEKFYQFVAQNFKAPSEPNLKGKIYLTFIVEKDGSLTEFNVLRDIGYGTGEEAIRVLQNCPKWIPGTIDNKPARVLYSMPITVQTAK